MQLFQFYHIVQSFLASIAQPLGCLALLLLCTTSSAAQEIQVHTVTKTIKQTFPYQKGYQLHIQGQKAEVDIRTWQTNEVSVVLELIAKHPEKKKAENDLEKMQFSFSHQNQTILLKNYVSEEDQARAMSSFRAKYTIKIPDECPVLLNNYFGRANILDLNSTLTVDSEFTTVGLTNVTGNMGIKSRYGDIAGESLTGNVSIEAHRSNITLSRLEGSFDIDATYGVVKIYADQSYIDLNINAKKSDVFFYDSNLAAYNYQLYAQNGNIHVPSVMDFDFVKEGANVRQASFKPGEEMSGVKVAINVYFGEIKIGAD